MKPNLLISYTSKRIFRLQPTASLRALMSSQKSYDLAVIGAGIYGIQAARTYLQIHPNDKVIVFETSGEVGGVWSTGERTTTRAALFRLITKARASV